MVQILKHFQNRLVSTSLGKKHTVEMYTTCTRHVSRLCNVQQKLAVNVGPSEPPDDIDVDKILLKSFDTAVKYVNKLSSFMRTSSIQNEWSAYIYILKFGKHTR